MMTDTLLAQARSRGYAVEHGFVTPGLDSVASAVLDHSGHPVAGVAVTAEREHLTPEVLDDVVGQVRRAALEISRRLGHRAR